VTSSAGAAPTCPCRLVSLPRGPYLQGDVGASRAAARAGGLAVAASGLRLVGLGGRRAEGLGGWVGSFARSGPTTRGFGGAWPLAQAVRAGKRRRGEGRLSERVEVAPTEFGSGHGGGEGGVVWEKTCVWAMGAPCRWCDPQRDGCRVEARSIRRQQ